MNKQFLVECLQKGMSTRQIGKLPNVNKSRGTIAY